jgi:hypothetical protein
MFGQPMSLYTMLGLALCLVGVALARGERNAGREVDGKLSPEQA